jgi:hypothetical protein
MTALVASGADTLAGTDQPTWQLQARSAPSSGTSVTTPLVDIVLGHLPGTVTLAAPSLGTAVLVTASLGTAELATPGGGSAVLVSTDVATAVVVTT